MADNLWPTDFKVPSDRAPASILREQGNALGERTSNIVIGETSLVAPVSGVFGHIMELCCLPLKYRMTLLRVDHDIDLYPAKIFVAGDDPLFPLQAKDANKLIAHLKAIFSRDKTNKLIGSLIAQSRR